MLKLNINDIVMLEKEVRFENKKGGDFVDDEVAFVYLYRKVSNVEKDYDEYGLQEQHGFYLSSGKETFMLYGPHTPHTIDGEIVSTNWQLKLQNNVHYKEFIKTVKDSFADVHSLLKLEREINKDMRESAQKHVEDLLYGM